MAARHRPENLISILVLGHRIGLDPNPSKDALHAGVDLFRFAHHRKFNARRLRSVVQDDVQERAVDLRPAVVMNETQASEFVHERAEART
jgi:arginyl-tRNA synthetase